MFQSIKNHELQSHIHTLSLKQLQNQLAKVKKTTNIKYIMDSDWMTKIERIEIAGSNKENKGKQKNNK